MLGYCHGNMQLLIQFTDQTKVVQKQTCLGFRYDRPTSEKAVDHVFRRWTCGRIITEKLPLGVDLPPFVYITFVALAGLSFDYRLRLVCACQRTLNSWFLCCLSNINK